MPQAAISRPQLSGSAGQEAIRFDIFLYFSDNSGILHIF
jgi:hypothetical protein